ncbi:glutathione S-transferase A1-like [Gracilinanus agilis]|uniref:glutathione S-transferase A1-like n=1 Tax=Gracilinanus agilis TaxID=191870 RepID=UPI001CFEC410|nr:glutathione S-transferase A1-like [Gracilinanus agilis]
MAGKPILHYFNGRGRMESVRWLLAVAGVEFEEKLMNSAEEFDNLIKSEFTALKSHGKNYLVGNQMSWADIQLFEAILMVEELKSDVLSAFPKLQEFKARMGKLPNIQKFLQPGSQRKEMDPMGLEEVKKIFKDDDSLFLKHMS